MTTSGVDTQRFKTTVQICSDVPPLLMARSVKFAQQLLNLMVVFPSRPSTGFPVASFRVAVTVRVVTPTEMQLP